MFGSPKSRNPYQAEADASIKLCDSMRLMEYINMYCLKRDEILYQCPILRAEVLDHEFNLEVECLEEMGDIFIGYEQERQR
jgi:hypothetical protein